MRQRISTNSGQHRPEVVACRVHPEIDLTGQPRAVAVEQAG
jgi:hypothetical protein